MVPLSLVPCPLCPELLDEEDPIGAGAHMGEHVGVVDLGPLHALLKMRHGLMSGYLMLAGGGPCQCDECLGKPQLSPDEQDRLDFRRAFGG